MKEHRNLERYSLEIPARIKITKSSKKEDEEVMDLKTFDVSAGGAFFYTSEPLSEGTEVKIDLILSLDKLKKLQGKKACIKINGRVLRAVSEGMAIRFNKHYKIIPLENG